jgi:L-ascorbate metabolism protein UlaG (beta-lactamase superfamily)
VPAIGVMPLGQSGFRFEVAGTVFYVDPYLSDSVAELEGADMKRKVAPPLRPSSIDDAHFVFVTHAHRDHCDPATIVPLSKASPGAKIVAPRPARELLERAGVGPDRLIPAPSSKRELSPGISVIAIPSSHPSMERDEDGSPRCVGYVFEIYGRRIYHSGDTSLTRDLLAAIGAHSPVEVAFLPVNEHNFMRRERGIVANMSIREAFHLAESIGARTLVPMHWDLFAPNGAFREEIELLYRLVAPGFSLAIGDLTL